MRVLLISAQMALHQDETSCLCSAQAVFDGMMRGRESQIPSVHKNLGSAAWMSVVRQVGFAGQSGSKGVKGGQRRVDSGIGWPALHKRDWPRIATRDQRDDCGVKKKASLHVNFSYTKWPHKIAGKHHINHSVKSLRDN